MKPAVLAPIYVAIYPELAEVFRQHGYALAIHGTLAKDFDLIAVPWADAISTPSEVIAALESEFAMKAMKQDPTPKAHGRQCYTIIVGHGTCYLDLSFVNSMNGAE